MAQPALEKFIRRAFLLKAEVTEGTDSTPAPATDGIVVIDGAISTQYDKVERKIDRPVFGGFPFVVANKRVQIEGTFELYPPTSPGAAAGAGLADCAKILFPCAMAETRDNVAKTTIYNPISTAIPSATLYGYHSNTFVKSLGSRGNVTGLEIKIGDRFMGKMTMMGTYSTYDELATPTNVVLPTKVPVVGRWTNTTCVVSAADGASKGTSGAAGALASLHLRAKSLAVDFGNTVTHKEYTEYASNGITDRVPKVTLLIAKSDMTNDFNPWFLRDNGTVLSTVFSLYESDAVAGSFTGINYSALTARWQIEDITETNTDGDYTWQITGTAIPSSAGNDEFLIGFGTGA